jgi:hypothetical protein
LIDFPSSRPISFTFKRKRHLKESISLYFIAFYGSFPSALLEELQLQAIMKLFFRMKDYSGNALEVSIKQERTRGTDIGALWLPDLHAAGGIAMAGHCLE